MLIQCAADPAFGVRVVLVGQKILGAGGGEMVVRRAASGRKWRRKRRCKPHLDGVLQLLARVNVLGINDLEVLGVHRPEFGVTSLEKEGRATREQGRPQLRVPRRRAIPFSCTCTSGTMRPAGRSQ